MKLFVQIFLFVLGIVTLLGAYFAPATVSYPFLWFSLIVGLLCLIFYTFYYSLHAKKGYYALPSAIFVLSYLIVGYQAYLLDCLGYEQFSNSYFFWRSGITTSYSAMLVSVGFVSFLIGYVACTNFFFKARKKNKEILSPQQEEEKFGYGYPILIACHITSFFIYLFSVRQAFWTGTFGKSHQSNVANFSYLIFFTTSLCCCIINQYQFYRSSRGGFTFWEYLSKTGPYLFCTTHFIALMSLRMGDRGPFIYLLLMFWGIYITQMKLRYCVISLVFAAFLLSIIGEARLYHDIPLSKKILTALTERQHDKAHEAPLAFTRQLSRSFACLHILTEEVPYNYSFYYGWNFFFNGIASTIPGMRTVLNRYVHSRAPANSSDWLITHAVLGDNPAFGMGSHVIADAYLDFGIFSVIFIMFLLGYFMSKADIVFSVRAHGIYALASSMVLFVYAIYIPRACAVAFPRYVVFTVLFLFIASRKRFESRGHLKINKDITGAQFLSSDNKANKLEENSDETNVASEKSSPIDNMQEQLN
jgi:hypothetical protein